MLIVYWKNHGTVQEVFSHVLWDSYMILKHWSEVIILALMLYILQSRFTTNNTSVGGSSMAGGSGNGAGGTVGGGIRSTQDGGGAYTTVTDSEPKMAANLDV